MLPENYQSHLRKEIMVSGGSNALFNGVICWYLIKDKGDMPWWGAHSFGVDILATAFILPWIVALIVIPLQRSKARKGKLATWDPQQNKTTGLERLSARLPQPLWLSSIAFGLIGLLCIAPVTLAGLYVAGVSSFTPAEYAIFKGVWAGSLAAILISGMVLVGLRVDQHAAALKAA